MCPAPLVKIATYNINGVNRRLGNLLEWMADAQPDVVCLQELKAAQGDFPVAAIQSAGYEAVWAGQKSWNGVAILARNGKPVLTRTSLPGDPADRQRRYIEAAVSGVLVASIYAPNGNPQPGPKFDYKLAWLDRLNRHAAGLLAAEVPVVLAGDFNVVPEPRDIYQTRSYDQDALVQPASREAYRALLEQGWTDAVRKAHPNDPIFTFWDYRRNRWTRDAGLRIDHILLSGKLAPKLIEARVDREARGREGASDHAPVWVELAAPNHG